MAVLSQFEYRLNLFTDAVIQPVVTGCIEVVLWWAIFHGSGITEMNGFAADSYLAYALWAAFFARITTSWMYEYMMIDEIDSGRINAILTRPITFYEFYLGQFLGYKILCAFISLLVPALVMLFIEAPVDLTKLPLAVLLGFYYLIMVHTMSFTISSLAFFYNRIHSLPAAKNFILWALTGELYPLDLLPSGFREVIVHLPFAAGTYLPVGYLTGRVATADVYQGFVSVTFGIIFFAVVGSLLWNLGRKAYSGTGA